MTSKFICADAFVSPLVIEEAIWRALDEDLGRARSEEHTSELQSH